MKDPEISIITPLYNRRNLLPDTYASILTQTFTGWQWVIVDDGSTDGGDDWAEELSLNDSRVLFLRRVGGSKGPSSCRNIGAEKSDGKYLIFLDSDDQLKPFCLYNRSISMNNDPDLDFGVFLTEEFENVPGDKAGKIYNTDCNKDDLLNSFLENENPWNVMGPIWKKDFFKKIGGFDEEMIFMEDPLIHIVALMNTKNFRLFYDLPADSLYRVNFHDDTKKHFYYNSIFFRILFYKKVKMIITNENKLIHNPAIKKGVTNLLRFFLLSRINEFPLLYNDLIKWLKSSHLFTNFKLFKIRITGYVYMSNNIIIRLFKLKGLFNKML